MKKIVFLILIFSSVIVYADPKLSVDISIDKLNFKKPARGVGRAGLLVFKTASVNNNGIVLNINNVNNNFDSQIFVRPTFLGFTTQFGDYGLGLEPDSIINSINQTELVNSKLVFDDNQLNLSGEYFNFFNLQSYLQLSTFRLYCQSSTNQSSIQNEENPTNDIMANCFNFLTLNGSNTPNNELATLQYEGVDKGDKSFILAKIKSFDMRPTQISANLISVKSVSNDSYSINASNLDISCAKDEDLKTLDFEKIKKACLNQLKIAPLKVNLIDKASKSTFNLDIKDVTVKEKMVYFAVNSGSLSDIFSTTYISNLLLNCNKETDSDLLILNHVIRDCTNFSRISIDEVKSTKPDQKDSSIQKISFNSSNGAFRLKSQIKFLGLKANVSIFGKMSLNEIKKQLNISVTDTQLPLGINSVKLLMYFLKKNLISKVITIEKNLITIQL